MAAAERVSESKKAMRPPSERGNTMWDENDGKIYASNSPKILLEVISARTASAIMFLTFAVFIIGFTIDVYAVIESFTSSNRKLGSSPCPDISIDKALNSATDFGCVYSYTTSGSNTEWIGYVAELKNVISVQLEVDFSNFTSLESNGTALPITQSTLSDVNVNFDSKLFCCYDSDGCGNHFSDSIVINANAWYTMLDYSENNVNLYGNYDSSTKSSNTVLYGYTFQNEEALPTRGKVKSYYFEVNFTQNGDFVVRPSNGTVVTYYFNVATRPDTPVANGCAIGFIGFTLITLCMYVKILREKQAVWLSEQKWLLWFFIFIILFQNPVYSTVVMMNNVESVSTAVIYMSYFIDAMAQTGFFVVWLLFADGFRRKTFDVKLYFYLPKILFGVVIFVFQIVILTIQFSSLDVNNTHRTPVQAVYNWSYKTKVIFCVFSLSFLFLLFLWTVWWFYSLWYTGNILQKLPYMSTRYLQLSYYFFSIQATLVAVYYITQYSLVFYYVGTVNDFNVIKQWQNVSDNVNTLLRQQTALFGKTMFLTLSGFILTFLFLPASMMENEHIQGLATTFAISSEERDFVVRRRKKMLKQYKLNEMLTLNQLVQARAEVFCVDVGLSLLNASYEVYYDLAECPTESGFGIMDLDRHGYAVVDKIYEENHEMFCLVLRHKVTSELVVTFRGTSSKKHWNDNLNYAKLLFDIKSYPLTELDAEDGLQWCVVQSAAHGDEEDESESDEDSDEDEQRSTTSSFDSEHDSESASEGKKMGGLVRKSSYSRRKTRKTTRKGVMKAVFDARGVAQGIVHNAASHTPGIEQAVNCYIHSGFWDAYSSIREFVHRALRTALKEHPAHVYFCGHSLGGAVATLAAFDVKTHTIPRINLYLQMQRHQELAARAGYAPNEDMQAASPMHSSLTSTDKPSSFGSAQDDTALKSVHVPKRIAVSMYNYGCPRVGNSIFAQQYNQIVPDSFRVVVDGDAVPGLPKGGYKHVGTEILIDHLGAGSIIIDPSFVERRLRKRTRAHISVHSLLVYRQGLEGVKKATKYIRRHGHKFNDEEFLNLAICAGTLDAKEWLGRPKSKRELAGFVLDDDNDDSVMMSVVHSSVSASPTGSQVDRLDIANIVEEESMKDETEEVSSSSDRSHSPVQKGPDDAVNVDTLMASSNPLMCRVRPVYMDREAYLRMSIAGSGVSSNKETLNASSGFHQGGRFVSSPDSSHSNLSSNPKETKDHRRSVEVENEDKRRHLQHDMMSTQLFLQQHQKSSLLKKSLSVNFIER